MKKFTDEGIEVRLDDCWQPPVAESLMIRSISASLMRQIVIGYSLSAVLHDAHHFMFSGYQS